MQANSKFLLSLSALLVWPSLSFFSSFLQREVCYAARNWAQWSAWLQSIPHWVIYISSHEKITALEDDVFFQKKLRDSLGLRNIQAFKRFTCSKGPETLNSGGPLKVRLRMLTVAQTKKKHDRQGTYKVKLGAFVLPLLQWERKLSTRYTECVCRLGYPARNAHAPYCHPWPVLLYYIFPRSSEEKSYWT